MSLAIYWERAEFPWALIEKMAPLSIVGAGIEGYGCPPMDPLSAGLIDMEINRGDGSLDTFMAVQAGLAMKAIARCGSEEQKRRPARGCRVDNGTGNVIFRLEKRPATLLV